MDRRTVQRAERGARLQMETLSSLAAALNVPVSEIISVDQPVNEVDELSAKSLVVLNRVRSGIALLNIVRDSYDGKIACEADPTPDNIDALTGVIGRLEELAPNPWRSSGYGVALTLSDRLRAAVDIGQQLKELEDLGVAFYAGTYTARTQVPTADYDTGEMWITNKTPYELVTFFVVIVASTASGERITVKASNVYVAPKTAPAQSRAEAPTVPEGDIPF